VEELDNISETKTFSLLVNRATATVS